MPISLLLKFWPHLLVAGALIGAGWYLRHSGYESGFAASEAKWRPAFEAAEREFAAATEREKRKEASSIALSQKAETDHEKVVASLNLRAAAAERRYASLLRQHTAGSSSGAVRQDGGASADSDAAGPSSELIDRTSRDFSALARRCESDAAALTDLQRWVTEQRALFETANPPADR